MDKPQVFAPDQLWVPEFIADPYPTFQHLRDQTPLSIMSFPAGTVAGIDGPVWSWALMKHDDVYNALRDHDTFSSVTALVGKLAPRLTLIQDDKLLSLRALCVLCGYFYRLLQVDDDVRVARLCADGAAAEERAQEDVGGPALGGEGRVAEVAEHGHLEEFYVAEVRHGVSPARDGPVVPELPEQAAKDSGDG